MKIFSSERVSQMWLLTLFELTFNHFSLWPQGFCIAWNTLLLDKCMASSLTSLRPILKCHLHSNSPLTNPQLILYFLILLYFFPRH